MASQAEEKPRIEVSDAVVLTSYFCHQQVIGKT
jgi:hypothetical protein